MSSGCSGVQGDYQLGQFDGEQFTPRTGLLTAEYGRNGYAAQTYSNAPDGRIIQVSWMSGGQYPEMPFNQQMSIPMELTLTGAGSEARLLRTPVPELESLRAGSSTIDDVTINEGTPFIADTDARLMDVTLTLTPGQSGQLVVSVRGQALVVDWEEKELRFQNSAVDLSLLLRDQRADARLTIQLLIDLTSVEVFLNGGEISGCFCFLPGAYIHPLLLMARRVIQQVHRITLFELRSSWNRG